MQKVWAKHRMACKLAGISAFVFATAIASPLHAQSTTESAPHQTADHGSDSAAQDNSAMPAPGEIVVTATKRSESMQRVPIAITAISGDALRDRGITSPLELGQVSPNLKIKTEFGAAPLIYMRGIGTNNYYATSANAIGLYNDGVFAGPNFAQGYGLFDLERTEILRGPQGTLFGRNTTGGLVNFVTVQPKIGGGLEGYVDASVGNFGAKSIEGALGFSLGQTVAVRLSGQVSSDNGYFHNVAPQYTGDVGARRIAGARAEIKWKPADNFELLATGHIGFGFGQSVGVKPGFYNCPVGAIHGGFQQGCTDIYGYGQGDAHGYYDTQLASENFEHAREYGFTLQAKYSISDQLDLVSLSSWDHAWVRRVYDPDGTPLNILDGSYGADTDFYSQEVRLSSNFDGPLNGVIGANYYYETISSNNPNESSDSNFAGVAVVQEIQQRAKTAGIFGELTFKPVRSLTFRAAGRWTADTRWDSIETFLSNSLSSRTGPAVPVSIMPAINPLKYVTEAEARAAFLAQLIPLTTLAKTWHDLSGRLSVDWNFAPRQIVYASYATGFKGGEFNAGALINPGEVSLTNPEYAKTWEVGYKGGFDGGKETLNVTLFSTKITNQQLLVNPPGTFFNALANAGSSSSRGVEVETSFAPTPELTGSLSAAYLDAHFISFSPSASQNFAGNRLAEAPRWNLSGSLTYKHDLGNASLGASTDFTWNSSRYFNPDNDPAMRQGAYGLVNVRAFYDFGSNRQFEISPFVKNLFDVRYLSAAFEVTSLGTNSFIPGPPRTYGVRLRASF